MTILDRYILKELIFPFFISVAGFVIFMIGDTLYQLNEWLIERGVDLDAVSRLLLYKLPQLLILGFPVGMLFATLLTLGRLSQDSETIAMRSGGVPPHKIMIPVLTFSLAVSIAAFYNNEKLVPRANELASKTMVEDVYHRTMPRTQQDIFFKIDDTHFYIQWMDTQSGKMINVNAYTYWRGKLAKVITAKRGIWEDTNWQLEEVVLHRYDEEGHTLYEGAMPDTSLPLGINRDSLELLKEKKTPEEMTREELKEKIETLRKSGIRTQPLEVEYNLKLSLPFASFILTLIAAPLGLRNIRSGRAMGVILSIILAISYYQAMSLMRSWGRLGLLPPLASAWLHAIIYLAIGIGLIIITDRR
jgi:lipopolysaccharide export system permease protein